MSTTYKTEVLLMVLISCCLCIVRSDPDVTVVNFQCNKDGFLLWDDYANAYYAVLEDLRSNTAGNGYNYYTQASQNSAKCYGHGACSGALTPADCSSCMASAYGQIQNLCSQKVGAQLQLQDCRVRYEQYSFTEPP